MLSTETVDGSTVPAETLLSALGGKYSAEILSETRTPTSAQELSSRIEIPIATCYRRIEELEDAGLLRCEGRQLSEEGRRTNVYRRTVDTVTFDFTGQAPSIESKKRSEAKNQLQDQLDE
ncbi:ArsR/SmtB family transcription factor [Natranaeroarchaeum aerophilus]|uniref:Helix-turn-helix domain-containing protein n=1 Tax=Natranaeroarchaeum aerophilus TaxID=2917711 RepID=A0AAE3FTX7_9EURY|nr:helix-turn-helix domain-containing protein [Natranaeroarchaeum aerophilus]MCL9815131.1 helix-turn-helix domain-containing protein [Natranaeroarchaeum aerophilus]